MQEAVSVRLSRFRTMRPAFDTVLRSSVLPDLRARAGALAVLGGRQGPEEVGVRLLASLWASTTAMQEAFTTDDPLEASVASATDVTSEAVEVHPVLVCHLATPALPTGILRVARGRLRDLDLATYTSLVSRDFARLHEQSQVEAAPFRGWSSDLVLAATGGSSFVMLTTWPDWSAIEAATGASISEPLRSKRMVAMDGFEVEHFELLADVTGGG